MLSKKKFLRFDFRLVPESERRTLWENYEVKNKNGNNIKYFTFKSKTTNPEALAKIKIGA